MFEVFVKVISVPSQIGEAGVKVNEGSGVNSTETDFTISSRSLHPAVLGL